MPNTTHILSNLREVPPLAASDPQSRSGWPPSVTQSWQSQRDRERVETICDDPRLLLNLLNKHYTEKRTLEFYLFPLLAKQGWWIKHQTDLADGWPLRSPGAWWAPWRSSRAWCRSRLATRSWWPAAARGWRGPAAGWRAATAAWWPAWPTTTTTTSSVGARDAASWSWTGGGKDGDDVTMSVLMIMSRSSGLWWDCLTAPGTRSVSSAPSATAPSSTAATTGTASSSAGWTMRGQ